MQTQEYAREQMVTEFWGHRTIKESSGKSTVILLRIFKYLQVLFVGTT